MQLEIKNRYTSETIFAAEIDCSPDIPESEKLRLIVLRALENKLSLRGAYLPGADLHNTYLEKVNLSDADLEKANLRNAHLYGANLYGANLCNANLCNANLRMATLLAAYLRGADIRNVDLHGANIMGTYLIDAGSRKDGYQFVGWVKDGVLMIHAGCRDFNISQARRHWMSTRGGTPLGDETMAILDRIEATAKIRRII